MPTVMFVVTTPFAVNAFLANHIAALSKTTKVILCTNLDAYKLAPALLNCVKVHHLPFSRRVSFGTDLKTLLMLTVLVRQIQPAVIHSVTPKAGLLAMLAGLMSRVPNRWHTFTGQVWATKLGYLAVSSRYLIGLSYSLPLRFLPTAPLSMSIVAR